MIAPEREAPRVPAHVQPFVEALGPDKAIALLLEMGGGNLYLSENPRDYGRAAAIVGPEGVQALRKRIGPYVTRVPLAKRWIARYLRFVCKISVLEIARRLHTSDVTVRSYLKDAPGKGAYSKDQLTLF